MAEPSLKRLQYFVALAQYGKFQTAADAMHISQPALSAELKRLEEFVGQPLFHRTPTTRLTAAGEALLPYARSAAGAANRFSEFAAEVSSGAPQTIAIGTVATFVHRGLPQAVNTFAIEYPEVLVTTQEATSAAQSDLLLGHEIDIACGHVPLQHPGVICTPAARESFWLCLPSNLHDLSFAEVADRPFITVRRSTSPMYHDTVVGICRAHGIEPRIQHEVSTWSTAVEMVAQGLGIALVPSPVARSHRKDERVAFNEFGSRPNAPQAWITIRREDQTGLVGDLSMALVIASEALAETREPGEYGTSEESAQSD